MQNFKLTIEYDGAGFSGWQVQKNGERTVQGELAKACAAIFKHEVKVIASGRTDSGVHAAGQVANFKADTRMTASQVQKALNSKLPADIVVLNAKAVPDDFHAQYSVKSKTYRYTILNRSHRSAFLRQRMYFLPRPLNVTAMRKAAKVLVGKHDFKSFQAHDPLRADKSSVRTIKRLTIKKEGDQVQIEVTADGFLYKMVRNIAGTLMAAGAGFISPQDVSNVLKAKDRSLAANTMPPQGLCLIKVVY